MPRQCGCLADNKGDCLGLRLSDGIRFSCPTNIANPSRLRRRKGLSLVNIRLVYMVRVIGACPVTTDCIVAMSLCENSNDNCLKSTGYYLCIICLSGTQATAVSSDKWLPLVTVLMCVSSLKIFLLPHSAFCISDIWAMPVYDILHSMKQNRHSPYHS